MSTLEHQYLSNNILSFGGNTDVAKIFRPGTHISAHLTNLHQNVVKIEYGSVFDGEKYVSIFLDETGEAAAQQRDSSRLKNKDTSFSC